MDAKPTSATLGKRLRRMLVALGKKQPFIVGSLVKIQRRCGNPNCRCAREGPKHAAYLLTTKVNGKTRAIYVPVDMVEEVRQWCHHQERTQNQSKLNRNPANHQHYTF